MNSINLNFTRNHTQIIKGLALLFMMVLHAIGSGTSTASSSTFLADYPIFVFFHPSFKICVGIFAFMIGYGYAFAKVKDWHYSVKHIWSLLKVFWLILLVITIPSILAVGGGNTIAERGVEDFIQNLFGVSESLNWYSWFVALYIFCMIVLPLIHRWLDEKSTIATIGFVLAFYLMEAGIHILPFWNSNKWVHSLFNNCLFMPSVVLGYYFAKQQVFFRMRIPKHRFMAFVGLALIVLAFAVRACCGSLFGFNLDIIYAPISICGILIIFNTCNLPVTSKVLTEIGNLSVYMWFFHALFFMNMTSPVYQPMICVSDNLFIVTIWTIILTYIISWILKRILDNSETYFQKLLQTK